MINGFFLNLDFITNTSLTFIAQNRGSESFADTLLAAIF
jgi:hypothetical protein